MCFQYKLEATILAYCCLVVIVTRTLYKETLKFIKQPRLINTVKPPVFFLPHPS